MCRNIRTLFNFDPPATDDEIRAAGDEVLVMPLHQKMGDDGFFLGRAIPAPLFRLDAWIGGLWRS